ncbi:MAG: 23S rRNA (uracil(1939)-C(5))-methyltransferase RlmD [Candidatus Cloacimonetes bacterium HGW-Cloacimonetes-1]|jgi:23S rRNA (uracil1939-C5)-methyltransferase|nr:MAG: 23S rRNA (uracil(1939)-C(5))-methyltransferase RlmD [Candidatus Cloacimonetes bacterium HGW-Cloacimonetes-1]
MNSVIKNLLIDRVGTNGYGIGFAEGKTIFVPFTMIGDRVDVELTHIKSDIAFGHVSHYCSRAEGYRIPDCEAFGNLSRCGGCDWLMTDYTTQLRNKDTIIRGIFEPLTDSDKILPTIAAPAQYHYRNKAFMPVSVTDNDLCYGIYERFSHKVVSHQDCKIQNAVFDPISRKILDICRNAGIKAYNEITDKGTLRHIGVRVSAMDSSILVILVTKAARLPFSNLLVKELTEAFPNIVGIVQNIQRMPGNVIIGDEDKVLWGLPYLVDSIGTTMYRIHYRSFFQINHGITELLYAYLRKQLKPNAGVIDAYCGIGTIGLYLGDVAGSVLGIEEVPEAIADAEYNAELNQIHNCSFICGKVDQVLQDQTLISGIDSIILDPPRKGIEASTIDFISAAGIPQVVYVSCNPMTLARDLKLFLQAGYELDELQPFDMFPQTWHVETVAVLHKK